MDILRVPDEIVCIVARLIPDQVSLWNTEIVTTQKSHTSVFAELAAPDNSVSWIEDIDDDEFDIHKRNPTELTAPPREPDRAILNDDDVPLEMNFISQRKEYTVDEMATFSFMDFAGRGITVYVHDTGIDLEDPEFTEPIDFIARGTYRWVSPKASEITGLLGRQIPYVRDDRSGHGTCVASKIVGKHWGVAKAANLVVVPTIEPYRFEYILAGLQGIFDDIHKQRKKGPFFPVVNFSYALPEETTPAQIRLCRAFVKKLVEYNAVIVVSAGNYRTKEGERELVDHYPALFAREFSQNMIVVGSVDVYGKPDWASQRGPLVDIWAPGQENATHGINCAGAAKMARQQEEEDPELGPLPDRAAGTSFAAPQVSGIVAYLYSVYPKYRIDGGAPKVLAKLRELMFKRNRRGPPCLWNGVSGKVMCN
ncbi:hypothetical protein N7510_010882 [Penicillium lagena]|uniref:uncharacterized protein n=1 Tax=Penicillium lagena TaxID=94218 RepID=UPI0025421522|nr:uncharacterized protein N7510_010882 [Penicillium lagena]KAJ5601348.1 hypothetical protein N7510_010882 [Penicillium lagena]